jgi:putative tryptophan/tyrosine transport system substrate-binding protein
MRRRDFVTLLGSTAAAWPFAGHTQQLNNHRIGYLGVGSAASQDTRFGAFRAGLAALGYVEGKNIVIEQRWLGNRPYDQLDNLARQLVDLKVDVIVTHATPGVLAAKRATTTIPIVIAAVGDAVETGLVSSLARPGGNATGTTFFNPELSAKRTELLKEAIPGLVKTGILYNPTNPSNGPVLAAVNTTAQSLKLELVEFPVREPTDLNGAFAAMAAKSVGAFVITEDPMLIYNVSTSATFALQHRLAGCGFPEFARAGGFVGYGVDFTELWRHAATFVDKVLKGTRPANIPVEQPTKFQTIVNLRTAKTIGVEVATSLLLRADDVIE